jgi:sortase A
LRPPIVLRGSAVADLSIPRIHLSAIVLHGSDAQTLRRGPGHLENTALPGESGNAVIAGHRDSFFRPLRNVQVGDDIFVDTARRRFHYRVTSLRVVKAHDLSVLNPTDDAVLTLITCYPFWVLGNAPDRYVVRATRVRDPTSAAFTVPATRPRASIGTAEAQRAAVAEPALSSNRLVLDDATLVRQTIERFRLTYNARLISRNDVRPGGPLKFAECDVSTAADRAAATCKTSSWSPEDRGPHVWTLALERADGGWAIRSIAAQ